MGQLGNDRAYDLRKVPSSLTGIEGSYERYPRLIPNRRRRFIEEKATLTAQPIRENDYLVFGNPTSNESGLVSVVRNVDEVRLTGRLLRPSDNVPQWNTLSARDQRTQAIPQAGVRRRSEIGYVMREQN